MASTAVGVVGPLAFVVVLELARLAREIPLVGYEGDTERLDYGTEAGAGGRLLAAVAGRFGFSGRLVSVGGFHVVFLLTELVLYGSMLVVYLTTGSLATRPLPDAGTGIAVVAFLGLLWVTLPVIVVDRYDDLARQGIRPFSADVHMATTVLYIVAIVALVEGQAVLSIRRTGSAETAMGFLAGAGAGFVVAKSRLYRRYLRRELDHLEAPEQPSTETETTDG